MGAICTSCCRFFLGSISNQLLKFLIFYVQGSILQTSPSSRVSFGTILQEPMALSRDYMAEVLACVESSVPNWNVRHLSLWTEMIAPEVVDETNEVDLESVEEATAVALYQEVRSKVA